MKTNEKYITRAVMSGRDSFYVRVPYRRIKGKSAKSFQMVIPIDEHGSVRSALKEAIETRDSYVDTPDHRQYIKDTVGESRKYNTKIMKDTTSVPGFVGLTMAIIHKRNDRENPEIVLTGTVGTPGAGKSGLTMRRSLRCRSIRSALETVYQWRCDLLNHKPSATDDDYRRAERSIRRKAKKAGVLYLMDDPRLKNNAKD